MRNSAVDAQDNSTFPEAACHNIQVKETPAPIFASKSAGHAMGGLPNDFIFVR
jgi:hypothetical protein